jgi:hypothetical protein
MELFNRIRQALTGKEPMPTNYQEPQLTQPANVTCPPTFGGNQTGGYAAVWPTNQSQNQMQGVVPTAHNYGDLAPQNNGLKPRQ